MSRRQHTTVVRRFERMSRLRDYALEKGAVNPRGWKVLDGAGHAVGVVRDIVVDTDRMTAAYVDVELDARTFAIEGDPRILVPMRHAQQEGRSKAIVIADLTRTRVAALYNAKAEYEVRFWDEWWDRTAGAETYAEPARPLRTSPPAAHDDPAAVPDGDMREVDPDYDWTADRRPVHPDERVMARERDIDPDRRRFDE